MVIRGRLAFNDQGELVEIAADAADPNNPSESEIEPVSLQDVLLSGILDGQDTAELQNLAAVNTDDLIITALVDDTTNDNYLTKINGTNTIYWGNVDPSTEETVEAGDLWIDNTEAFA